MSAKFPYTDKLLLARGVMMQLLAETNRLRQEGVLHEVRAEEVGKWASGPPMSVLKVLLFVLLGFHRCLGAADHANGPACAGHC